MFVINQMIQKKNQNKLQKMFKVEELGVRNNKMLILIKLENNIKKN